MVTTDALILKPEEDSNVVLAGSYEVINVAMVTTL